MKVHQDLHEKSAFKEEHFKQWIFLFKATVDDLFQGDNAEKIKQRATSIATVMTIKTVYGGIGIK
jgi:hemoglobin